MTIKMNEIFLCLTCYGQKLNFVFGNWDKDNTSSVKQSGEDEIGTIILKSDIYDAF